MTSLDMVLHNPPTLSVIVLAGGYSSRMGRDKALLTLPDGSTLISRTVEIAQSMSDNVVVVTPWPERYRPLLPSAVQWVQEPLHGKGSAGPLSGFALGWQQVCSTWCLLLPCDMPNLDSAVLQDWWQWIEQHDKTSQNRRLWDEGGTPLASLAIGKKGWEPLCGFYHRSCTSSLIQHVGSGQRSFQSWLATIPVAAYTSAPPSMFLNCNRPSDLPKGIS
ncbi:MAG: molybdenum cofactor guanylyltransferase [Cyanobacteria bacterium J06649_4]